MPHPTHGGTLRLLPPVNMALSPCQPLPWRPRRGGGDRGHWCELLTCVVVLLITCTAEALTDQGTYGKMTPSNPIVESHKTIELNCTLNVTLEGVRPQDIYFKFRNEVINPDYVQVVDNFTAMLRYPNATRSHTGHWFCHLITTNGTRWTVGQQYIIVADPPVTPRITGCRVANWQNMTCTWEPKKQDTGLATNQTLYWTLSNPPQWNHCPHRQPPPDANQCSWYHNDREDTYRKDYTYYIVVKAENKVASRQTNLRSFDTGDLVEPNPVGHLTVGQVTTDTVALSWTAPSTPEEILYRVRYQSSRTLTWQKVNVTGSTAKNVGKLVTDLMPYTNYTFNVTCIPSSLSGFWSKHVVVYVNTSISVPAANPVIPSGAFQSKRTGGNFRDVDVFYQAVPEDQTNGPIEDYLLYYKVEGQESAVKKFRPTENMSFNLNLSTDKTYHLWLKATTQKGTNKDLKDNPIVLLRQDDIFPTPAKMVAVALEDDVVLVNWDQTEDAFGYTLYWCKGSTQFRTCDAELNWVSVDGNITAYNITLVHAGFNKYKFGISVEKLVGTLVASSGLLWTDCTYQIDKPLKPPRTIKLADYQRALSISLQWTHPTCEEAIYIDEYLVYYCRVDQCPANLEENSEHVTSEEVEGVRDDYIIEDLAVTEYKVWMRSRSRFKDGLSARTKNITTTVSRSGLADGIKALIIIGVLIGIFFIIFGLFHSVKVCRKKVKEEVKIVFEGPPEVPNHISSRVDDDHDVDYMVNYTTVVDQDQHASEQNSLIRENQANTQKELTHQPNGHITARVRTYLSDNAPEGRKLGYSKTNGKDVMGKEALATNDTALALLAEHDYSKDTIEDEVPMTIQKPHASGSVQQRVLPKVPTVKSVRSLLHTAGTDRGQPGSTPDHPSGVAVEKTPDEGREVTSGPQSAATIPSYSRCGMPDEEPVYHTVPEDIPPPPVPAMQPSCLEKEEEREEEAKSTSSTQVNDGALRKPAPATQPANKQYQPPRAHKPHDLGYSSWSSGSMPSMGNGGGCLSNFDYNMSPTGGAVGDSSIKCNNNLPPIDQSKKPHVSGYQRVGEASSFMSDMSQNDRGPLTESPSQDITEHIPPAHPMPFTDKFTIKNNNNGYVTVNM